MSLTLALNNSLSGLNINRQSLAVLSQNIANANTQGYSRKIMDQESLYLDGNGAGVSIQDISRKVDDYLIKSVREQTSLVGQGDTIGDYNDRIQILLGKPGDKSSIDSNIGSFFNSLQSLAQTPENSSLRVNAVNLGKTLAGRINDLSSGLNGLRFQADQDISLMVTTINADIKEIDKMNKTIGSESALGKPTAELEDKRDTLIRDLSKYLDISVYKKTTGEVNISTNTGLSLLDDSVYQLSYNAAGSADTFVNDASLSPVNIYRLDEAGNQIGTPKQLITGGTSSTIVSYVNSGNLAGLVQMRDRDIPAILTQLDNLAATIRDQMNIVHNTGTGFPGAQSLTGTHMIVADDYTKWDGKVRIAVLGSDGKTVASPYADESGVRPMTLDLSTLDTGAGAGQPNIQGIIDEINRTLGAPQTKMELGNINNMTLVSDTKNLPNGDGKFSFDFNMENISASNAGIYITGMQVLDSTGTAMAAPTSTMPAVNLAGTYSTISGSRSLTVDTIGTQTLHVGDKVYLSQPSGAIDGIPTSDFGGFFTVTTVSSNSFTVNVATKADAGGSFSVAGQTAAPKYTQINAGESVRTKDSGIITADLSANDTSPYYTIKINVSVDDGNGNISDSVVTYRVNNNDSNIYNTRYAAILATGDGKLVYPQTTQATARALLVDENGVEIAKVNGVYTTNVAGFLKIESGSSNSFISIDSLNSTELGRPNDTPKTAATNRGFSHFFGLNNFFVDDGDARVAKTKGSAVALKVESRLTSNPNLIALGKLTPSPAPDDPTKPTYTYERTIGDNTVIQALAQLGTQEVSFLAAGGLGQTKIPIGAYAGQIIGAAATNANAAQTLKVNAQTLLDGYNQRSDSISGVNLDEELANTVIYQNAYSASARVITVVNAMFDTLLQAAGT